MAQITDYASLKSNIADWLSRSNLTNQIPVFIQLAEARLRRTLRSKHAQITSISLTAGTGSYTVPSGVNIWTYQMYITSPEAEAGTVDGVKPNQLYDNRRLNTGLQDRPELFTIIDTTLLVSPIPDVAMTVELVYEGLAALSDSNNTNYLLTNYPDVYLYGALVEAEPYLMNDERVALWKTRFDEAIEELHVAKDRAEFPNTPVQKPPVNMSPLSTIKGRR